MRSEFGSNPGRHVPPRYGRPLEDPLLGGIPVFQLGYCPGLPTRSTPHEVVLPNYVCRLMINPINISYITIDSARYISHQPWFSLAKLALDVGSATTLRWHGIDPVGRDADLGSLHLRAAKIQQMLSNFFPLRCQTWLRGKSPNQMEVWMGNSSN